jgi:NAD(P)-dependent dehydrogenase (short-subunit alcohol dehydrogenase family)
MTRLGSAEAQRLDGRVAVVTGAASGIGRSIARRLASSGAEVVLVDLDEARLRKVAEELCAELIVADVSTQEGVDAMLDRPKVDILVNNAGVLDGLTPLAEVDDALWAKVMRVNVDGPFRAMRAVLPGMVERGGGVILNTCSAAALSGGRAGAAYTASKHALLGLTRSTAWYYGNQGVRCNAIAPGAIQTRMHTREMPSSAGMARTAPYFPTIPEHGKAMEVAEVAVFLCSDAARYVNGAVLPVDGGWLAY